MSLSNFFKAIKSLRLKASRDLVISEYVANLVHRKS